MIASKTASDLRVVIGQLVRRLRAEHRFPLTHGSVLGRLDREGPQGVSDLATKERFSLVCGYSMDGFHSAQDLADFERVCSCHSHVVPTEAFSSLKSEDVRLRQVSALEQRARALEAEIAHRTALEADLREREEELREFLDNAVTEEFIRPVCRRKLIVGPSVPELLDRLARECVVDQPIPLEKT